MVPVVSSRLTGAFRTLLLAVAAAAVVLTAPPSAQAFNYYWGKHPDKDRIVVKFDGDVPKYSIARTSKTTIDITLPDGFWAGKRRPPMLLMQTGANAKDIKPTDTGLRIDLRDDTFGYLHFVLEDTDKLVVDVFEDSMGARWKPGDEQPQAQAVTQPAEPKSPEAAQATAPEARPEPQPAPEAMQPPADAAATARPDTPIAEPAPPAPAQEPTVKPTPPAANATSPAEISAVEPSAAPTPSFSFRSALPPRPSEAAQSRPEPAPLPEPVQPAPAKSETSKPATPEAALPSVENKTSAVPEPAPSETPQPPAQSESKTVADNGPSYELRAPMPKPGAEAPVLRKSMPAQAAESQQQGGEKPQQAAADVPDIQAPQKYLMDMPGLNATAGNATAGNATAENVEVPPPPIIDTEAAKQAREAADRQAAAAREQAAQTNNQTAETPQVGTAPEPLDQTASLDQVPMPEAETAAAGEQNRTGPDGEPIPTTAELLEQARLSFVNEDYETALTLLKQLRNAPGLTDAEREEVLYFLADSQYALHRDDMRENYETVTSAYKAAMNFNPQSSSIPQALLKMGVINLEVDNPREAEAYFNILRKQYPGNENIPLTYFYWGDYYFKHGRYQEAADSYQYIIQQYPDSKYVRESGVGLARSLERLGFDEQAAEIVDYLEKRWPRFYVEYPPFLRLVGDVSYQNQEYEKAKLNLWTFYNLDPEGPEADLALARIGDIYVKEGKLDAAREVYQKTAQKYPDREGGLIARMRLAEKGIYDKPTTQDMFTVFDQPYSTAPEDIYKEIVSKHPDSALAPLAQLKLAMWYLHGNQQRDALVAVQDFLTRYPESPLMPRAKEVASDAFGKLVDTMVKEENYAGAMRLWDGSPAIRDIVDDLDPKTRIALGLSSWKQDRPEQAWNLVSPFLVSEGMPQYSEMALNLALSVALENGYWDRIVNLRPIVDGWEVTPKTRDEYNYALALAYENLGQEDKSAPMWSSLTGDDALDPLRRAYAQYFMAVNARKQGDLKQAYDMARDSLEYFLESNKDPGKINDLLPMLVEIAEGGGRIREAIGWNLDYLDRLQQSDPQWPAARYRMAQLYRKAQDVEQWRAILEDLSKNNPDSLYGRMADMDLRTQGLVKDARQFAPNI